MQSNTPNYRWLTIASITLAIGTFTVAADDLAGSSSAGSDGRGILAGPDVNRSQDKPGRRHFDGHKLGHRRGGRGRGGPEGTKFMHLAEQLNLSGQQKAQVKEIRKDAMQGFKSWREQNGDKMRNLREQMRQARESGEREKTAKLFQQIHELRQTGPSPRGIADQIKAVLNEEQKFQFNQKLEQFRGRDGALRSGRRNLDEPAVPEPFIGGPDHRLHQGRKIDQLDLTDEQRKRIREIREQARQQIQAILTDDQKAKLGESAQDMHGRFDFPRPGPRGGRRPHTRRPDRQRPSDRRPGQVPDSDTQLEL